MSSTTTCLMSEHPEPNISVLAKVLFHPRGFVKLELFDPSSYGQASLVALYLRFVLLQCPCQLFKGMSQCLVLRYYPVDKPDRSTMSSMVFFSDYKMVRFEAARQAP